jgi:hypothetical protein
MTRLEHAHTEIRELEICSNPVFVVGAPRSGTTGLAMALGEHSDFWTSGESIVLWPLYGDGRIEKAFQGAVERPAWTWFKREEVGRHEFLEFAGLTMNALFTSRSDGRRWVDHTPVYALMIDSLADMLPGAQFVHILRDGRSVVESMVHFLDRRDEEVKRTMIDRGFAPKWASDFGEACRTWRRYVETLSDFEQTHPDRVFTVAQEQLVRGPQTEFARIFEFLEVPCEEPPVTFFRTHRVNSSFERDWNASFTADELSNPWQTWSEEQRAIFCEEAGETLVGLDLARASELRC